MPEFISQFHFLRPWSLLLLIPAAAIVWHGMHASANRQAMQKLIAPHLLEHLIVSGKKRRRPGPIQLLAVLWALGILALAGPTWRREPSPFARDTSGLVIVLKVTPTMTARDIQPSRLTRATQKIHDLLARRAGAQSGLIAYSGSPHLVMPLTSDPKVIDMFSQALSPDIMPTEGDSPLPALEQAETLLRNAQIPGAILLVADSLPESSLESLKEFRRQSSVPVYLYAMAAPEGVPLPAGSPPAPPLDLTAMKTAASALDADLVTVTADNGDVETLARAIKPSMATAGHNETERWKDMGFWLLPALLGVSLFFFKRGWMVAYD